TPRATPASVATSPSAAPPRPAPPPPNSSRACRDRGAPRLRRGAPNVWGVWGSHLGAPQLKQSSATAPPTPRSRDRGAPRLRRGAPNVGGVWGAISGPPVFIVSRRRT